MPLTEPVRNAPRAQSIGVPTRAALPSAGWAIGWQGYCKASTSRNEARERVPGDAAMKGRGLRLDDRDLKILAILQREGRITKAELAKRVNLSATPCWARLQRLEEAGIIESYGAKIAFKHLTQLT